MPSTAEKKRNEKKEKETKLQGSFVNPITKET
jgi:hypothetical protein